MKNKKYDIFISYAHSNNKQKYHGNKGWMDHFFEKIKQKYNEISGENLNPWLDKLQLSCGDVLKRIDNDGLEKAKLFIPILSPPYMKSEWCRKEFLRFVELAKESNSLHINNKSRILPIVLFPFDNINPAGEREVKEFEEIKKILNPGNEYEIIYQEFFEEIDYMKYSLKPTSNEFNDMCHVFSQVIRKTITKIIDTELSPEIDAPGIFLGLTSSNSTNERKNIFNELKKSRKYKNFKFNLLPEEGGYNSEALEKLNLIKFEPQALKLLEACQSSFHILDSTYGRTPEDSQFSYLELQYKAASTKAKDKDSNFKCYVYISSTQLSDERQKKFIDSIYKDIEKFPKDILLINSKNAKELSEILITAIEVDSANDITHLTGNTKRQILLMLHSKDEESKLAKDIDDYMFENDIEVRKPVYRRNKSNTTDFEKYYKDSVEKCEKAIIFFGSNATDEWCNSIKIDILKSAKDVNTRISKRAICVTDPQVMDRMRKIRSHDFESINCEEKEFFKKLDQFIKN